MQTSEDDEDDCQVVPQTARDPRSADIRSPYDILSDPLMDFYLQSDDLAAAMSNDDTSCAETPGTSSNTPGLTPSPSSNPPVNAQPRSSSSRAIIPIPASSSFTPITTASPTGASPLGAGPTSSTYVVPPRPKPGRKPATDEPASKRKAQNRESQRAFRARKAAKIAEMQEQADHTTRRHREELNEMLAEKHRISTDFNAIQSQAEEFRQALERVTKERDYWKDRTTQIEAQHNMLQTRLREQNYPLNPYSDQQHVFFPQQSSPTRSSMGSFSGYNSPKSMPIGCGDCKPNGDCACINEFSRGHPMLSPAPQFQPPSRKSSSPAKGITYPAVDPFADREIDFTAQFASKRPRVEQQPSVSLLAQSNNESDNKCGFCTDDSNCLCRDQSLQLNQDDIIPNPNALKATGPGSCDACQTNPKQRAWCQRVAQLRNEEFLPTPSSRNSSISSALETMEPHIPDASTPYGSKPTLGCNEAFRLFDGRVSMDSDNMDWISNLKTVPRRRDTMLQHPRKYSAIELDTAGIIATLGSTMKPIQFRHDDGDNIDIVRIAKEYQRTTQSPHRSPGYAAGS